MPDDSNPFDRSRQPPRLVSRRVLGPLRAFGFLSAVLLACRSAPVEMGLPPTVGPAGPGPAAPAPPAVHLDVAVPLPCFATSILKNGVQVHVLQGVTAPVLQVLVDLGLPNDEEGRRDACTQAVVDGLVSGARRDQLAKHVIEISAVRGHLFLQGVAQQRDPVFSLVGDLLQPARWRVSPKASPQSSPTDPTLLARATLRAVLWKLAGDWRAPGAIESRRAPEDCNEVRAGLDPAKVRVWVLTSLAFESMHQIASDALGAFAIREPGARPKPRVHEPRNAAGPRVWAVHRPGATQVYVAAGAVSVPTETDEVVRLALAVLGTNPRHPGRFHRLFRDKLQVAYNPWVRFRRRNSHWELTFESELPPPRLEEGLDAFTTMVEELRQAGPSESELSIARVQVLNSLAPPDPRNVFFLMGRSIEDFSPVRLTERSERVKAVDQAALRRTFSELLAADRLAFVVVADLDARVDGQSLQSRLNRWAATHLGRGRIAIHRGRR